MENKQNKTKRVKKENINHTRVSVRAFILFFSFVLHETNTEKKDLKSDEINAKNVCEYWQFGTWFVSLGIFLKINIWLNYLNIW